MAYLILLCVALVVATQCGRTTTTSKPLGTEMRRDVVPEHLREVRRHFDEMFLRWHAAIVEKRIDNLMKWDPPEDREDWVDRLTLNWLPTAGEAIQPIFDSLSAEDLEKNVFPSFAMHIK